MNHSNTYPFANNALLLPQHQFRQEFSQNDPNNETANALHEIHQTLAKAAKSTNTALSKVITPSHLTLVWGGLAGFIPTFIKPLSFWIFAGEESFQGLYKICSSQELRNNARFDLQTIKKVASLLLQCAPNFSATTGAVLLATGAGAGAPYCFALAFTCAFLNNFKDFKGLLEDNSLTAIQKYEKILLKCIDCACIAIMELGVLFGLGIVSTAQKTLLGSMIASGLSTTIKIYEEVKELIFDKVCTTIKNAYDRYAESVERGHPANCSIQ